MYVVFHFRLGEYLEQYRTWVAAGVVIIALMLIVHGVGREEADYVLRRGTTVCLECIGID